MPKYSLKMSDLGRVISTKIITFLACVPVSNTTAHADTFEEFSEIESSPEREETFLEESSHLASQDPVIRIPTPISAITDYSFSFQETLSNRPGGLREQSAFIEANSAVRFGFLGDFVVENGVDIDWLRVLGEDAFQEFQTRRSYTRAIYDLPDMPLRISAGDVVPRSTNFQGIADLFGISVGNPYQDLQPTRSIRTAGQKIVVLERRSLVRIFDNDALVDERLVSPGQYTARDFFPEGSGGNLRVEIRDDRGRTKSIDFSGNAQAFLLAPGISEFEFSLGYEAGFSPDGIEYDFSEPVASGFYRRALTPNLTGGLDFQYTSVVQQVGVDFVRPALGGILRVGASISHLDVSKRVSQAISVSQEWDSLPANGFFSFDATYYGKDFAIPGFVSVFDALEEFERDTDFPDRIETESAVFTNLPFEYEVNLAGGINPSNTFSINGGATYRTLHFDQSLDSVPDDEWNANIGASWRVTPAIQLNISGTSFQQFGRNGSSLVASFQVRLGRSNRTTTRYRSQQEDLRVQYERSAARSVDDYSYSVGFAQSLDSSRQVALVGDGSVFTNRGDLNFGGRNRILGPGNDQTDFLFADWSGGLVLTPEHFGISKSGFDTSSYVIIDRPSSSYELYIDPSVDESGKVIEYSAKSDWLGSPILADKLAYFDEEIFFELREKSGNCVILEDFISIENSYKSVVVLDVEVEESSMSCEQ